MDRIYVIGIGFRPLEKRASEALLSSEIVLANKRLLDVFKGYNEYTSVKDRIIVHPGVNETIEFILNNYQKQSITLLAAGDPMFFGIGRLIVEKLGKKPVEVYPDLSSLQFAFSRIKETSNNALLISLHGGPDPEKRRRLEYELTDLPSLVARHEKIGILTDRENNPSTVASAIQLSNVNRQSSIKIFVCEKLGYPDERITEGTPAEISGMSFEHPNVVIIVNDKSQIPDDKSQKLIFGLTEPEIIHSKGLITKDEIRAVAIHKLRLYGAGVLWDIGAGSGSVSIEAARICPDCRVYAVEKEEERVKLIRDNIKRFNVSNIEVIKGRAPEIFQDLPSPDRVFIGGSNKKMSNILQQVAGVMSRGIAVINAATIETLNEAVKGLEENHFKVEVTEVSVSRSREIGGKMHMSALNPVFIIRGTRGREGSGFKPAHRGNYVG